jgi:class 3 adenylate cyclase
MSLENEVNTEVSAIFRSPWTRRVSETVPESNDIQLGNDCVTLDATVLYADLVDSTDLVDTFKADFAAEIYKAYLATASRIVRARGGSITAFDGDRIMGVFIGGVKNSQAAKAALQLNWAVTKIINPAIKKQYPNTSFQLRHVAGIDTGPLLVARTGIRGSNDLVWVGAPANHAAKLCAVREGKHTTFITAAVYGKLRASSKLGGNPKRDMWTKVLWPERGASIYGSEWIWKLA